MTIRAAALCAALSAATAGLAAAPDAMPGRGASPQQQAATAEELNKLLEAYLGQAAAAAKQQGYATEVTILRGTLAPGRDHRVDLQLDVAGEYTFRGVCDHNCGDLDLALLGADHQPIHTDDGVTDVPVLNFTAARAGSWPLRVRVIECATAPCAWAVAVFRK